MTIFPTSSFFVGRAAELSALQSAYEDENVRVVLISGEAGIGKSRLVHEFVSRLGSQPQVLTGRCLEFGNDGLPYAPFIAIVRALFRDRTVAELAGQLPALAAWLPALGTGHARADRMQLFSEFLTLLERIADARPLILLLEDLHWADSSSRELLAFVAANLFHPNTFLLGTHRKPTGPLRQLVAELARQHAVRQLHPAALSRHEVGRQLAALLAGEPDPTLVSRVFARSQGNPLFVEALSTSPEDTPAELQELLIAGLSELTVHTRHLLDLAAVAGPVVEHVLLEKIANLPEPQLHEALRHLVDKHLLVPVETGYSFRHALIQQAVYDRLLPAERLRMHARLAEALCCNEGEVAQLAAHAYAAGDYPQALIAAWRAAQAAEAAFAEPERLHLLQRVLDLWDRVPDPEGALGIERMEVLQAAVSASFTVSAVARGLAWADEALASKSGARLYYLRGKLKNLSNGSGSDDLRQALQLLPEPVLLRGEVLADLAVTSVFGADSESGRRYALAAIDLAERLGSNTLAARAYAYLGLATAEDDLMLACEHFVRSRAAADSRALPNIVLWESAMLVAAGQYAAAIEVIQQGLAAAHETYQYAKHGPILAVKWVQALTALGRREQALRLIDETLGEVELPDLSHAALLISRAEIQLAQGNRAAAQTDTVAAENLLGGHASTAQHRFGRMYWIKLRTLQVRLAPQEAQSIYATALADDIAAHPHEAWQLVAAVHPEELPVLKVAGPVDEAYRAAARRDWDAAIAAWRALEQPYELAQCLLAAARELLAKGNRRQAQPMLAEVAVLGPEPLRLEAEELAGRGGQALPENVPSAPMLALTAREMDVLRLVAEGKSNRQIAAELFISSNTAGVHVSRILAKLGAATRTEAARKLFDAGQVGL